MMPIKRAIPLPDGLLSRISDSYSAGLQMDFQVACAFSNHKWLFQRPASDRLLSGQTALITDSQPIALCGSGWEGMGGDGRGWE